MKIAIITLQDFCNYGNRLQNAAVERILQDFGYATESLQIRCRDIEELGIGIKYRIKKILPFPIYKILKRKNEARVQKKLDVLEQQRSQIFLEFSKKYTNLKEEVWFDKAISEVLNPDDYTYFVTGSDQVWNPDFAGNDLYFLTFVKSEKRIALAASIGYDKLDESLMGYYVDRLNQMNYISVREKSAVNLIRELTGREVDLMIDPTLIVDRSYWLSIMERPKLEFPKQYILSFFLGEEVGKDIQKISELQNLPVIHMNQKRFEEWYVLSPSHFLYMVKHAEYVLTDSFHAVAFSIQFNTSFFVFHRKDKVLKNMFSRMESLLEIFDLRDRIYDSNTDGILEKIEKSKWNRVNRELNRQRKIVDENLRRVLKMEK